MSQPPLFFLGAMSPYSWFAAERIDGLMPGAVWRPVFAGGVFKASGRSSWGLDERRAAGIADCETRAQLHGLGPIRWPDPWPTLDALVARAMLFAEGRNQLKPFALAAMRLAFREGGNLGDHTVIQEAARRVSLDPTEVSEAIQGSELKAALRSATDDALNLGVFGVPTVVVADQLFWGDDRLQDAACAAHGLDAGGS